MSVQTLDDDNRLNRIEQKVDEISKQLSQTNRELSHTNTELSQTNKELSQTQKWNDRSWDVIKWVGGISAGLSISAAIALFGILLKIATEAK